MNKINSKKPSLPTADDKRVELRHGMKMVLEDRIAIANDTDDLNPLFDTLSRIDKEYKPDFKVAIVLKGFAVIDGHVYSGGDGLIFVKEFGEPLFAIYREKVTSQLKLSCNQYDLMTQREKDFHDMIKDLLNSIESDDREQ